MLGWTLDYLRFRLNRTPVLVLGNQKSGTSAIAHLLADCCGLDKTIDTPAVWERVHEIETGEIDLAAVARTAPEQFATDLIKEPYLTFLFAEVRELFPRATCVFVVRDPRDNVRSILDRLELPGGPSRIDAAGDVPPTWHAVLFGPGEEPGRVRHVRRLARRWRKAARVYLRAEESGEDVHLVRYEDFMEDRAAYIRDLARRIGREPVRSIADRVDVQYQPRGQHRGVDWDDFFSEENLRTIREICGRESERLGYGDGAVGD